MTSNKGITVISLIISIILMLIFATLTIATSISAYQQIKFETARSEIEEMQSLVDQIASDYQVFKKETNSVDNGYLDYFKARYQADFSSNVLSSHFAEIEELLNAYPNLRSVGENGFLFKESDLVRYFDLKGINRIVVDFSTRTVYSVKGIKDPYDKDIVYYTQSEWEKDPKITYNPDVSGSPIFSVTKISKSGTTFDLELRIGKKIDSVSEIYAFCTNSGSTISNKVQNFRIVESVEATASSSGHTVIRLTVEGSGQYTFKVITILNEEYDSESINIS